MVIRLFEIVFIYGYLLCGLEGGCVDGLIAVDNLPCSIFFKLKYADNKDVLFLNMGIEIISSLIYKKLVLFKF